METSSTDTFEKGKPFLMCLAAALEVHIGAAFDLPGAVTIVTDGATVKIPMDDLVDREAERARLQKEKDNVLKQLAGVEGRLSNKAFTDKAPEQVVQTARDQAQQLRDKLALLEQSMEALG